MAKQGKKMPKKYRQAKAAAKPAAEAAFPGKKKAVRRDPMAKYSAEDRELFKELKEESKKGYLTTDKGEKVFVKPDETAKERIARERKEAMRKYRERVEAEDGPKQKAPAKKAAVAPAKKEAPAKKAAAKKAAPKKAPVYNITTAQPEKAAKGSVKPKFIQKKATVKQLNPSKKTFGEIAKSVEKGSKAKASTSKAVAIRPKGAVATTAKKAATTVAKKGGAAAVLKGAGRVAGKVIGGRVGMALTAAALAKPVLKALVQTPEGAKKKAAAGGKTPGPEARSNQPRITGQGRFVGAGGATTKVGSTYTVKKGDTLSGIAKNAGVSLADIRKANPKLMTEKKYKQGSAIWSGTKVRIPKK